MSAERCSDLSLAAGEPLAATATNAAEWLVVEVPGSWPRDVGLPEALPERARAAADDWLARTPSSRLLFVRRPGRNGTGRVAFRVRAREDATEVRRFELASAEELAEADLDAGGNVHERGLVLVCGHGSRDACCALRGTAVFGALERKLGEEELWISSHHGGHRFAANVLVLPSGLHFGRVPAEDAATLVGRALAGTIELERYRGRTCYSPAVQAAERAVREAVAFEGVADLRLISVEGSRVRFRARDGADHEAVVEELDGWSVPASCGVDPEPQKAYAARLV